VDKIPVMLTIPSTLLFVLFQYVVASGTIASVNEPLLRLELYVSKSLSKVEEASIGRVLPENQIQTSIAEFTRAQLDALIGAMSAIELVCFLVPQFD
jgi:hypothetical protein